ncbi:S8 family peptidase [Aliikangiella coralliicola]|uniref:S8 family peptidase n=1 Tax=Aliikangiella coralliicola TaxID=2592383 RepID=A0A545UJV3_9GAMM|nr:S8 family peptidase [Aliikangiella coralliicola]TQV89733.1 S8 family peptidase [Aliikangiella coralliicola]
MRLSKVALAIGMLSIPLVHAPLTHAGELKSPSNPDNVIQDQYIVVFKSDALSQSAQTLNSGSVSAVIDRTVASFSENLNALPTRTFKTALQGAVFQMDEATAKKMAENPLVDFIEPDEIVSINDTQHNPTWGLDRVDQRSSSLDSKYVYDTSASNVNVYVIDTGVNNHSDFGGRVYNGYDFIDNDSNSSDCQGHGTHVAGTVASATWGVAKGAKVYGVRVLDCQGSGSYSAIISGIEWVANNHSKPAVANMSLGGSASSSVDNATSSLVDAGVVTVVAAGNDNRSACNYSPARAPKAITVASTANGDSRSSFSNYGNCVDIFAPGSNITSTSQSGGSTTMSGTSMASPHVAGIAALYLAGSPNASPSQVEQAIKDAATTNAVSNPQGSPNLLAYSRFGDTPPPPPPGDNILKNGVPVSNLSKNQGEDVVYTMEVPSGATNIKFEISGGSGDADLYVKFGSTPTDSSYDCRPYRNGNNESCTGTQTGGTYYVRLKAYSSFSGVTLKGSYDDDNNPPGNDPIDETVSNISVSQGQWTRYTYDLPAGYSTMTISTSGGSGDVDLYVRFGAESTLSQYDCRPYRWGNSETCTFNTPSAGTWHIDLYGYSTSSGVTLNLKANP